MSEYPLPVFHFMVEWGGTNIGFTEVSGLDVETEVIEYRHGASPEYHSTKMPGLTRYSNITLKRGIFLNDNEFYDWWKENSSLGSVERRDLTISLLNAAHEPVVVWKVKSAFPVKITGPVLNATSNEVAIESIEIVHEGLYIQNG